MTRRFLGSFDSRRFAFFGLFLSLSALGLSACAESKLPSLAERGCSEEVVILPNLDTPTALGFSPRDMLNMTQGSHQSPLYWRNVAAGGVVRFDSAPEKGISSIATAVDYRNGQARWVRSTPKNPIDPQRDVLSCPDRIEVDVELSLQSTKGALQEKLPAVLYSTSAQAAAISHQFSQEAPMQGNFQAVAMEPQGTKLINHFLELRFSPHGLYGSLGAVASWNRRLAQVYLADWPTAPNLFTGNASDCLFGTANFAAPLHTRVQGLSARAVATALQGLNRIEMVPEPSNRGPKTPRSSAGTSTAATGARLDPPSQLVQLDRQTQRPAAFPVTLTLTPTGDRSCFTAIDEATHPSDRLGIGFPAMVDLQFQGHHLRLPVATFAVNNADGFVRDLQLELPFNPARPLTHAMGRNSFLANYGDPGFVLSGHSHYAVDFRLNLASVLNDPNKQTPLMGRLSIVGISANASSPAGRELEVLAHYKIQGQ